MASNETNVFRGLGMISLLDIECPVSLAQPHSGGKLGVGVHVIWQVSMLFAVTGIIGRGFTGGTNGEVFSNGTGDVYGVKGTGKGFDASAIAEINGAIYSGPKDGGADTWAGGFTSYNVGIFGFVFSYFHGGGWKGFAFGVGVAPEGVDFGVTKTHTTYVPIIPIRYLTPCSPLSAANK